MVWYRCAKVPMGRTYRATSCARFLIVSAHFSGVRRRAGKMRKNSSATRGVRTRFLDFDARGRYLLYAVDGLHRTTRWIDTSGMRAPVEVGRFDALSDKETHAYEAGAW